METKNAVISYTNLGVQHTDHGILSFWIGLDYGGAGQGFGGLVLDTGGDDHVRRPTILAASLLLAVDRVFQKDWEKLKGTSCRAIIENGTVKMLGHFLKDLWMWYDTDTNEFKTGRQDESRMDH